MLNCVNAMNQPLGVTPFVGYVEQRASADPSDALTATAAGSFLDSMRSHAYADVSKDSVRMWIVDMALSGLKPSTRRKYFSRIYTIWREWKSAPGEDPFEAAKDAVELDIRFQSHEAEQNLRCLDRLLFRPKDDASDEIVGLFLYLFYNPMASLREAVGLRFDDTVVDCPQIDEIIDGRKGRGRRGPRVFGLERGRKREPQVIRDALEGLRSVAETAGMRFASGFSRGSITAIWIAAALRVGVSVADIRALVSGVSPEYPSLALVPVLPLSDARKREVVRRVADSVNDRPRQWFVMKMRAGQNPDTVKEKIKATTEGVFDTMTFWYPTRKVLRPGAKGKAVKKDVPYIPGVLFFQISRGLVPMLMYRIGEVAWCFRYTNSAGSDYCTISRREMMAFQRCIGEFTPDVEMELEVRDAPLEVGSRVRINGGGRMMGEEGVITSVGNANGTRTYTLSLTGSLMAKWTVKDMEEIYIEPVDGE